MKRAWLIALAAALLAAPAWAAEGLVVQLKDGEPAGSAGYLVARDQGYYAAEGLDVTIRPGRPGAEPLDALAAGATDLAVERMPAALVARERGLPVVNIAQPAGPEGLALVCWRRAGIADLRRDLAGRTVAAPTGADHYAFAAWMNVLGVPLGGGERGVTLIESGANFRPLLAKRAACEAGAPAGAADPGAGQPPAGDEFVTFRDEGATLGAGLYALQGALDDPAMRERLVRFVRASMRGWAEMRRAEGSGAGAAGARSAGALAGDSGIEGSIDGSGRLDLAAAERTVRALLAGPEPALSAPPSGAWTRAITDAAAQAGPGTAPERPPAAD